MTLTTTEELKHLASSDNTNELTRRLARECLANREAQPVAWRHDDGPFAGIAITRAKSVADSWIAKGWTVTPLYTAPPAPVVVKLPAEFYSGEGIVVRLEQVMAALAVVGVKYERKGGACRAEMLAQPVSSGYKLPPHVYRELVNSLRDTAVKFSGSEQLRERLNTALSQFIEPDHHHMRTAATKEND
ncbi:TPA: hypothetical protein ACKP24_001348 [Serratia marcescens]